jgi:hypothetical protein
MHFLPLRIGLTLGPLVFLAVAVGCIFAGGFLLELPPERAGAYLLLVEATCGISIGLTLAALFAGGRPAADLPEEPYRGDRPDEEGEEK